MTECFRTGSLVVLCFLASCAPTPLLEMRAYSAAFQQTQASSDVLLDDLSVAERRMERAKAVRDAPAMPVGVNEVFDPRVAAVFASEGDPPFTAAMRRALGVVGSYNAALVSLAEGRGLDQLQADASRLADEAATLSLVLAGASATPGVGAAVEAAKAGFDLAARSASRAAFRAEFLQRYQAVDDLLVWMRDSAAVMFPILTRTNLAQLRRARIENAPAPLRAALAARHEAYRTALSTWVLSLDETRASLRQVKAALDTPGLPLGELAGQTARLRSLASAVRQATIQAREDASP